MGVVDAALPRNQSTRGGRARAARAMLGANGQEWEGFGG